MAPSMQGISNDYVCVSLFMCMRFLCETKQAIFLICFYFIATIFSIYIIIDAV